MIPKVIHYCWFGGNPKNALIEKCIASWRAHCPDYRIIEWNESNYDVTGHPFMKAAYASKKWAFVSDYARIDILNRHGGVYLDTDVELLASLDPFLDFDFFAGFESAAYVAFGLGFGSVAGHPVLGDILETYDRLEFTDNSFDIMTMSCPKIQTEALRKRGLICNNQNQVVEGCHIFSTAYFCPMSYETGETTITEDTVSIHHYDMSWFTDARRRSKQREWRLVKALGPALGRRVSSVVDFPGKLAAHHRNGDLAQYLRFLIGNNLKGRGDNRHE